MSNAPFLRNRSRNVENDSQTACSSESQSDHFEFPFMEVPSGDTFSVGAYLSELLESPAQDESEILQNLRILSSKPRLADFAQCVLKWTSQGLVESTPIKVGDMQLPLFHWVVLTGSHEVIDWLLNKGFDPFLGLPTTNWTPLHALALALPWLYKLNSSQKARWQNNVEQIVEKLAHTMGAQDKDLVTPMHVVARRMGTGVETGRMYDQMFNKMVLSSKVGVARCRKVVEKQDRDGNTVLHLLAVKESKHVKKAVSILGEGFVLHIRNHKGETPYDIAMRHGLDDLADYLEPDPVCVSSEISSSKRVKQTNGEKATPPAKKSRVHRVTSPQKPPSQKRRFFVSNRRKSASSGPNYSLHREKRRTEDEVRQKVDFHAPPVATSGAKAVVAETERAATSSSSTVEPMDVSSVVEVLVGSSVWEQLPGAAVQAKQKLEADLDSYQKEITVISRAVEATQRELDERRRHLERLQQDVYSVREKVHQLEDQDQRYRERGHVLGDLLKEVLEKIRRLDKFVGGSDGIEMGRKDS